MDLELNGTFYVSCVDSLKKIRIQGCNFRLNGQISDCLAKLMDMPVSIKM